MSIEEEISEDLGFKLDIKDNGIPLFEPLDLQNLATKHLKLLAIHDDLMVASNSKCIKVVSLKDLDDITTIEGEFSITQLHFVGNELFVLDDSKIKSLTVEQLKNKDYSFRTIREGFVDILPSPSGILALTQTTSCTSMQIRLLPMSRRSVGHRRCTFMPQKISHTISITKKSKSKTLTNFVLLRCLP